MLLNLYYEKGEMLSVFMLTVHIAVLAFKCLFHSRVQTPADGQPRRWRVVAQVTGAMQPT